jgi:HTH-type transcriptional regulator/antitoxin HigA
MDGEKEEQANIFAEQELLPRKAFNAFAVQVPFSKAAIRQFAREVGIAPGIVVGQLQHKGLLPQTHCNDLKVTYKWNHE